MLIIFDLDGTLIDSSQDLTLSVNATRSHLGLPPLDPDLIRSYVGNGAAVLMRRAFGSDAPDELVARALDYFLKYYRAHSLEHTRLYSGIHDAVFTLSEAGHTLAVLTNKPAKISQDIVAGLGLRDKFLRIYGGDSLAAKKPDPIGIVTLMNESGYTKSETWMIGDSGVDVQTARNAGVRCAGVAWGFQPEAFDLHKPDFVISDPPHLTTLLPREERPQ